MNTLRPNLVGAEGFEPSTNGLKVRCATAAPYSRYQSTEHSISVSVLFVKRFVGLGGVIRTHVIPHPK